MSEFYSPRGFGGASSAPRLTAPDTRGNAFAPSAAPAVRSQEDQRIIEEICRAFLEMEAQNPTQFRVGRTPWQLATTYYAAYQNARNPRQRVNIVSAAQALSPVWRRLTGTEDGSRRRSRSRSRLLNAFQTEGPQSASIKQFLGSGFGHAPQSMVEDAYAEFRRSNADARLPSARQAYQATQGRLMAPRPTAAAQRRYRNY